MRSITIFFILSFVPSDAKRGTGGRAALSELDHGSVNRSNTGCNVNDFIDFKILNRFGGSGSIFSGTGGLRKEASAQCMKTYGIVYYKNTPDAVIDQRGNNPLQQKCKKGVQIGKALCGQTTNKGPSIVPLDIINRFEIPLFQNKNYTAEAKAWNKWTQSMCEKHPKPAWTGFQDCYHACQSYYVDCKQTRSCKICVDKDEIDAGKCDGIQYPHNSGNTFLGACVQGCSIYTTLKKEKGGGPACEIGDVTPTKRTMIW